MNKKYYSKIILFGILGALLFGCEKDPDLRMPDLQEAVTPDIHLTETSDILIDYYNPGDFQGEISVDYYWDALAPQSMDLVVVYNRDRENQGVLQQGISTFPTNVSFSVQDLVDALPNLDDVSELTYTDRFDFYANITMKDGTVLNGADTLYTVGSSDISNYPGVAVTIYLGFKCSYDPLMASGAYNCFSDTYPTGWEIDGPVTLTVDPVDETIIYVTGLAELDGNVEDGGPLVMHIDPDTYEVTIPKVMLASDVWGVYHNFSYEGSGIFESCTGNYVLNLSPTVDEGGWGTFPYVLTRE